MFINEQMAKVAIDKSILKEYRTDTDHRVVYLNDGDEFQIQLFNPSSKVIGAKISINGDFLSGLLVIRPGERIWLERPLYDNNRKFKFETYTVDDDKEVRKAIKNNGDISIYFYEQIAYQRPCTSIYSDSTCKLGDYLPSSYLYYSYDTNGNKLKGIETYESGIANSINTCSFASSNTNSEALSLQYDATETFSAPIAKTKTSIETGRITSGSKSNQTFNEIDMEFESISFKIEHIKILPMSNKPYTNSDLQKVYCTECGRKISSKFKYCPYCGNKCLEIY